MLFLLFCACLSTIMWNVRYSFSFFGDVSPSGVKAKAAHVKRGNVNVDVDADVDSAVGVVSYALLWSISSHCLSSTLLLYTN